MEEAKPFPISKEAVLEAYKRVKANKGTYGIDEQSIADFESDLENNLYKIWNRMSSGTYFPKPVRAVAIPKKNGGTRLLGIPTVEDRIAQMTAKMSFEPCVEPQFYDDSYGYRPNKSMKQALEVTRKRCWKRSFVLEFDIKGLFDHIRHDHLLEMVKIHAKDNWVILYIERWLKAPFQLEDGTIAERTAGTPQGGVISPVLANLFLHYVFDDYMVKEFPTIPWVRYADDGITHCVSVKQAEYLLKRLQERFAMYGLELNLEKTKIVYCKSDVHKANHEITSFDFLGYTFRPRKAKNKHGTFFTGFLPAISGKAKKAIRTEIRSWKLQLKSDKSLTDIAKMFNSKIQGWLNHYAHFYKSELYDVLCYVNGCLLKWAQKKYKKLKAKKKAVRWLENVTKQAPKLFAHWKVGIVHSAG